MEWKIQHKDLGEITLRLSPRARYYSIKVTRGRIIGILPPGGNSEKMMEFIEEKRPLLIKALKDHPVRHYLDESTELQTTTFRLHIFCTDRDNFNLKLEKEVLSIACPLQTDFTKENVQELLQDLLGKALEHEAKRVLPKRLHELALRYRFKYTGVKISKSRSNWGSCTARKSINLSRSLMLLPSHLIDYVLLHELCHTEELNHSDRFWMLMDRVTGNKAWELRDELKKHVTL